ncbi:3-oxoacyl-[acyl-carrier-protein] synthase-1 [Tahibacter aquaticus]|uniref:3-oxoacyl-[acyl-carrier-protein] synthase-1 n=1 Tax=Tahibacter aquaticus TaxID=520092 RepID=A0A4R6YF68_9GAMM|nr:hypothetical protein [Tahibacter aquaticus]TDR34959.1 3-oxoacyl-[acyl-carrier-protein] synthase-1 [Tahibacter aquaticus]
MNAQPLFVTGAGACTAIGMTLAATDCALRAGMDHFQESDFVCRDGDPIRVARLPDQTLWGKRRLARWAVCALDDCLRTAQPRTDLSQTPVLLLAAERERPHSDDDRYRQIYAELETTLGARLHSHSRIVTLGRTGIGAALQLAHEWLLAGPAAEVVILGVDSYLDAATINHYLAQRRLLTYDNSQGFLPGEAAAAIRVSLTPAPGALRIDGIGFGDEPGRIDGSTPSRALGLTRALRAVLEQSPIAPEAFDLRLSDQNGESFYAREAANAFTRLGTDGLHKLPTLTLADCVGEVGAALGPLMLGWVRLLFQRADRTGGSALAHFAGDDGTRVALALCGESN